MGGGAPGEIRTPGLFLRRKALYPAELQARNLNNVAERGGFEPPKPFGLPAFQASAFGHSAISP